MSDAYRMEIVTSDEAFGNLAEVWNALLTATACDVAFLRWEWLWTWWNTYRSPDFSLHILLFFTAEELVGICPFYIRTRRQLGIFLHRSGFFLGTTRDSAMSEYMDIIASNPCKSDLARLTLEHFLTSRCCDELFLCKIRSDSITCATAEQVSQESRLLLRQMHRYESACVKLPETYEEYFAQLSANMRTTIKTRGKRLDSYAEVVIRKTESESELAADFQELVRLHQMRWTGRGYTGSFADSRKLSFHAAILPILLKGKMLELWLLRINGQNIAAFYNIRCNTKVYFYQSGIDTTFDSKLSPGVALNIYCIQDAIANGIKEYDFMIIGKNDAYKKKFTEFHIELGDYFLGFSLRAKIAMTSYGIIKNVYRKIKSLTTIRRQDS